MEFVITIKNPGTDKGKVIKKKKKKEPCHHGIRLIVGYLKANEEPERFSFWVDWLCWHIIDAASGYLEWVMASSICFGPRFIFSLFHITCQHGRQWNTVVKIWSQTTQQNTGIPLGVTWIHNVAINIFQYILPNMLEIAMVFLSHL